MPSSRWSMTIDATEALLGLVEAAEEAVEVATFGGRLFRFTPYPKQLTHLGLGAGKRERLLMAGNRLGKSETGAYEAALHLTGEYPKEWSGRRFSEPTKGWLAGV